MSDVTVKRVDDIPPYAGPNVIPGIKFRPAARALGITAWGMNVLDLDARCTRYYEHDHLKDGQEEVYTVLRGSATLHVGDETWLLEPGVLVRVGPGTRRKIVTGPEPATVLAIGATPGQAYVPRK